MLARMATERSLVFIPRVLWGALLAATLVYLYIGEMAVDPEMEPNEALLPGLAVAALVSAVASFLLPRFIHRAAVARADLRVKDIPDPNGSVMFRERSSTIRVFADPNRARQRAYQLFLAPFILSLALTESIAIDGLILRFTGFPWVAALPFFAASWALYAVRFPRIRSVLAPLEAAEGARFADP